MRTISLLLIAIGLIGCSTHKSTVIRRVKADGSITEITRSATRTLFDADSKLVNNRVESVTPSGTQTISIGTLSQQTSGSNAVQLAREVEKIKNSVPSISPSAIDRFLKPNNSTLEIPPGSLDAATRDALRKVIGQ